MTGQLSYMVNILLAAGWFGTFFTARNKAKKAGVDQLEAEASRAALDLIRVQKEKLHLLSSQNEQQQKLIDELTERVSYLEGLVLRGSKLVEPGSLPDVRRSGRARPPGHPKNSPDGSF